MILNIEQVKNKLTADLINYGNFVNYIDNNLLTNSIGEICCIDENSEDYAEIVGTILGMKMTYFFPLKFLITFIKFRKSERMLLRIFLNTLKEKYKLGNNWQIVLVPFIESEDKNTLLLYNMAAKFADLRFIDYCRSEGVKILDEYMLPPESYKPVEIAINNQFSEKITQKLFSPINRNDYIESQNLMRDIIKTNTSDLNIKMTALAQFIFSTVEAYDYYHTIDVVDKINPFYVFNNYFGPKFERKKLRNYANRVFILLMEINNSNNTSQRDEFIEQALQKYKIDKPYQKKFQNALINLLEVSELDDLKKDLFEWGIFNE